MSISISLSTTLIASFNFIFASFFALYALRTLSANFFFHSKKEKHLHRRQRVCRCILWARVVLPEYGGG